MVTNFSTMLMRWGSCDGVAIVGGVAAGGVMLELALDIGEHAAGAEAEKFGVEPGIAEFFFHQREPFERLLGSANAAGRLEANSEASLQGVFANGARHDEANGKGGVDGFFAGGSFDEVGAGHHGDDGGARDIAKSEQIAGAENDLEVRGAASVFEGSNFVRSEVLMKSAPAIMATMEARATLRRVSRSPVPRMTLRCAGPQACLKEAISSDRKF